MMSLFIKDVNELSNKRNKRKKKEMWIRRASCDFNII